ncbi:MAG: hypothetical protein NTY05_10655 [Rhodocyclales bacterium]|nr:hypothetical protein [Rhodocyclales bacterium]
MVVRIVRLGTARSADEGTRIGTVRRPPRGVPKTEFASGNWYDVWFPNLAPSVETMKLGQEAATPAQWAAFIKKYRTEMSAPAGVSTDNGPARWVRHRAAPDRRQFFPGRRVRFILTG